MSMFGEYVITLQNMGLLDVILPFILIFTIAFAVLQKSRILGEHSHRFNVIVSFALALVVVVPHVTDPGSPADVVAIINSALPNVSLLMIASLMVLLLIGVFGSNVSVADTPLAGIVVLFSIIAVAYAFIGAAGVKVPFLVDSETRTLLVVILVFGIIVWFITSEPTPAEKRQPVWKTIDDMFGGTLRGKGGH